MKLKSIYFLICLLINISILTGLVAITQAAPDIDSGLGVAAKYGGYENVTDTTLSESIGRVIRIMMSLTGTIFLGLTVYGGILWMTAAGNDEQVEKATKIFRSSVLGLVIIMASYSLTLFAMFAIGGAASPDTSTSGSTPSGGFWSNFAKGFGGGVSNWGSNYFTTK